MKRKCHPKTKYKFSMYNLIHFSDFCKWYQNMQRIILKIMFVFFRKQFYFDTQNGTARDFYPLENPEDIVFETYTPSQPWILPDNIFRKPQCPQGSSGQQRNMANPVTLVLLAFLSISQFSAPLILKSSIWGEQFAPNLEISTDCSSTF